MLYFSQIRLKFKIFSFSLILGWFLFSGLAFAQQKSFEFIPAETPYILVYTMQPELLDSLPESIPQIKQEQVDKEKQPAAKMMLSMLKDWLHHLDKRTLTELGLKNLDEFQASIFGLGLWPVMSLAISDQKKFTRWVAKNAKQAGMNVQLKGKIMMFVSTTLPFKVVMSLRDRKWMNIALVPDVHAKEMLPYITGKKVPSNPLSKDTSFKTKTQDMGINTQNMMYVDIERLVRMFLGKGEGVNKHFALIDDQQFKNLPESCVADYLDLTKHFPYFIFGQSSNRSKDGFRGRAVLRLSSPVAQVAQTFVGQSTYSTNSSGAVVQLNLNFNIKAILNGLQQLFQHYIQKPFTCPNLAKRANPQKLQMLSSQIMIVPPFLFDLKGISLKLAELQPLPKGQVIISANNVMNLINIAKQMKPNFAQIQLPAVGAPAQKIVGPFPPNLDLKVEIKEGALGLATGEKHSKELSTILADKPIAKPPLFQISYDIDKIIESFTGYLNKVKQITKVAEEERYKMEVEIAKAEGKEPPPPPATKDQMDESLNMLKEHQFGLVTVQSTFTTEGMVSEIIVSNKKK